VCVAGKLGGREQWVAEDNDLEFHPVRVVRIPRRKLSPEAVRFGGDLVASMAAGISVVRKLSPSAVVGFGGYVSFPTVFGAVVRGVPVYLHEQNALAGKANVFLSRFARGVFVSYEAAKGAFGRKSVLTGNPSRYEAIERISPQEARGKLGLDPDRKTVFVFGGSQGARSINNAVADWVAIEKGRDDFQVLHLAGEANRAELERKYNEITGREAGIKVVVKDYLGEMELAYFAADVAVCRAGATSIAEITSLGVPAILIPYPFATGDHQAVNAAELEEAGAALVMKDSEMNGRSLGEIIGKLFDDEDALEDMSRKSAGMYTPGAAKKMAETLMEHIN